MKLKLEFVKREIAGECFLVPVGAAAKKYSGLFAMNEQAAFLWDKLPDAPDEAALTAALLEEYEVEPDEAARDTAEFIGKLKDMGIV